MKNPFKNTGVVTRSNMPKIQDTVHALVSLLREDGFTIYLNESSVEEHCVYIQDSAYYETVSKVQLGKYCDLVVVPSGDGIFLSATCEVTPRVAPVIGINQGHLGFPTQTSCDTMVEGIRLVLEDKYLSEERILIGASITRDGETIERAPALSDTILPRGGAGQMIEFEVFINQESVYTQCSDGLIISTLTGSTAYALTADGPIMQAGLHVFTLMPICLQSMTNRPIAIPDTSVIEILITKSGDTRAHSDGQSHIGVRNSDRIITCHYYSPLHTLHPTDYQCFKTLCQKLRWGEQLI